MKKAIELHSIEVFALWAFYCIEREKRVVSPLMAFTRSQFGSTIDAFNGLSEGSSSGFSSSQFMLLMSCTLKDSQKFHPG